MLGMGKKEGYNKMSPQRVAGRPPLLFILETVLRLPVVDAWRSEKLWDGPYGCGYAATDSN